MMGEKKASQEPGKVGKFFRSVVAEIKKVAWPSHRETTIYTIVVIATVIVVALAIGAFDTVLTALAKLVYG
jgi:preprotein translocase subunit SecE